MILIDKLVKPYSLDKRAEFIVKYDIPNNSLVETEVALEAWTKTKKELDEAAKEAKIMQIKFELDKLDLKSIRAIRANDQEYLVKYEAQAEELRKQLKQFSGE